VRSLQSQRYIIQQKDDIVKKINTKQKISNEGNVNIRETKGGKKEEGNIRGLEL